VEDKLKGITEAAGRGRWAEGMDMADKELELSLDPRLVMAGAMMHFCAGDNQGAKRLFGQSLSIDPENNLAKLMLFIIDWRGGQSSVSPHRQDLLALEWRSPAEFLGYVTRVLEGLADEETSLKGWDTDAERGWLCYIVGLIRAERGEWVDSERLLKEAVLAADMDDWVFFLASAQLDQVQQRRLESFKVESQWAAYQAEREGFKQAVQRDRAEKEERKAKLAEFNAQLEQETASPKDKRGILEKILESHPGYWEARVGLAFYSAMEEDWAGGLEYARSFLERDGRQSASRLSVGLLEAEILHRMGREEEARASLEAYGSRTRDPWYRAVSEVLLGKRTGDSLKKEAGKSPENIVTLHAALGFWAEGSGDKERAIEHYKEALQSLMDTWIEFDFAKERIKRLRQPSE